METYKIIFLIITYLWLLFYIFYFLNIFNESKHYFILIDYFNKLILGFILLYLFNPFKQNSIHYNSFHKQIILSTSFYLITSTTIREFIHNYNDLKNLILHDKIV